MPEFITSVTKSKSGKSYGKDIDFFEIVKISISTDVFIIVTYLCIFYLLMLTEERQDVMVCWKNIEECINRNMHVLTVHDCFDFHKAVPFC